MPSFHGPPTGWRGQVQAPTPIGQCTMCQTSLFEHNGFRTLRTPQRMVCDNCYRALSGPANRIQTKAGPRREEDRRSPWTDFNTPPPRPKKKPIAKKKVVKKKPKPKKGDKRPTFWDRILEN